MIARDGNRLRVTSDMTMETVGPLLAAASSLIGNGEVEFDLSGVPDADSAALSLMFEWMRLAQASHSTIFFSNLPHSLISLATLYGVLEMIPQRVATSH
jgi:phospholipid transport system transporter-binding protein